MSFGLTLLNWCRQIEVNRFNRLCVILAGLWLFVTIPLGVAFFPTWPTDFAQFYMGGIIALRGDWYALYPIPWEQSLDNPGLPWHSFSKPQWELLRRLHYAPDETRFILPPPAALLFIPLAFMKYPQAFWIWTLTLTACVWGVACFTARLYRVLAGHPSHIEGLLVLLIAISPMTARAIRIANVSPPLALMIALSLYSLVHREEQTLKTAGAIFIGAVLKYASLVLGPLLVAMRRWRTLSLVAGLGIGLTLVTLALAGPAPFLEFNRVIMPTLSRPSDYPGNQSLPGLMARLFGRPLPLYVSAALGAARLGSFVAIILLLLRTKQHEWLKPVNVFAGVAILLSWLMVFSPIAWEHWPIFLCPAWAWMLWEARSPGWRRNLSLTALTLLFFPAGILQVRGFLPLPFELPEPLNSWQLVGVMMTLGLASWRLAQNEQSQAVAPIERVIAPQPEDDRRIQSPY